MPRKFKVNQPVKIKEGSEVLKWFPNNKDTTMWVSRILENGEVRVFDGQSSFDFHENDLVEDGGEFITYFKE